VCFVALFCSAATALRTRGRSSLEAHIQQVVNTGTTAVADANAAINTALNDLTAARSALAQAKATSQQAQSASAATNQRADLESKAVAASQAAKIAADKALADAGLALNAALQAESAAQGDLSAANQQLNGLLQQKPAVDTEYASSTKALQNIGQWPTVPGGPTKADIQALKAKDEQFYSQVGNAQTLVQTKQATFAQRHAAKTAALGVKTQRHAQSKTATSNLNTATAGLIQAQTAQTAAANALQQATAAVAAALKAVVDRIEAGKKAYSARIGVLAKAVSDATAAQTLATNTVGTKAAIVGQAQQHRNHVAGKLKEAQDSLQKAKAELNILHTKVAASTEAFNKAKQHTKDWYDAVEKAQHAFTTYTPPAV